MSAIEPLRAVGAPLPADPPLAGPVAIPQHVVAAIAQAAVEAYIAAEKERKAAAWRAYYAVNGEEVRRRRQEARERRRIEQQRHPLR